jgi:hypothetical protein
MVCICALFGLATVLATFQKIGKFFSQSSGHPAFGQADFAMTVNYTHEMLITVALKVIIS